MHYYEPKKSIYQNKTEIIFDENTHTYFNQGKVLPSVSEIMRGLSETHYANIPPQVLEKAAKRGTKVHKAIELYELHGTTPEKEIKPYLLRYKVAKKLNGFEPVSLELMLSNDRFCGMLDCIAKLDDKQIIIDFKNTAKINTDLLEVQMAGYLELCEFNEIPIDEIYVLHITKSSHKFELVRPNKALWALISG